jgi:hypothetical protein
MKAKRGAKIRLESADEQSGVDRVRQGLTRLKTMAGMSPELQKLAAYFDDLRMRNRQAAVAVLQEGRSIKSVRAAQRVAYFIPRNGFTQESFALQIDVEVQTLRSLLRNGKARASVWEKVASEMGLTVPQLLNM